MFWKAKVSIKVVHFVCRKCFGFTSSTKVDKEVALDGDVIKKGDKIPEFEEYP